MRKALEIPLSADAEAWVRKQSAEGLKPRHITKVLQLSELTGESPDSIVVRYKAIESAVKSTIYGT